MQCLSVVSVRSVSPAKMKSLYCMPNCKFKDKGIITHVYACVCMSEGL